MISCYVLTGNARRSYCSQDAEFSRLSIFRSEFLLKPKLHQEHSSVADTFNSYFHSILIFLTHDSSAGCPVVISLFEALQFMPLYIFFKS